MQYDYYAGLDLHKEYSYITVLDAEGQTMTRKRVYNEPDALKSFFSELDGKTALAVESTYNWYWLVDLLEDMGIDVSLSNPYKTKIIGESKTKTDKIDSSILAQLLRIEFLPCSYIADKDTRDKREWLRYRLFLVRQKTCFKASIHGVLARYNCRINASDLFGKEGKEYLKDVILPDKTRKVLDSLLVNLEFLEEQVKLMDKKIREEVKNNKQAQILMSIPGIGHFGALLLLYEVGDFSRFSRASKFISYTGMAPSVHSSGDKTRTGKIMKEGNKHIRWYITQAAAAAIASGKDIRLMRLYKRVKIKRGGRTAIIAVAKELLNIAYHLIKKQELYNPYHLVKQNQAISGRG